MTTLDVVLLNNDGKIPTRGSSFSAGFDLYSSEKKVVAKRQRSIVSTGIAIGIPAETYGRIAPMSDLAAKYGIDVGGGVIDPDYTGEVKVILFNNSDNDFEIKKGDRIAQLILEKVLVPNISELVNPDLAKSTREDGGFSSTALGWTRRT